MSTGAAASRGRAEGAAARWVQGTRRPLESSRFVGFWGQNLRRRCWGAHRPEPAARKQTKVKVPGAATERGLLWVFFASQRSGRGEDAPQSLGVSVEGTRPQERHRRGCLGWFGVVGVSITAEKRLDPSFFPTSSRAPAPNLSLWSDTGCEGSGGEFGN